MPPAVRPVAEAGRWAPLFSAPRTHGTYTNLRAHLCSGCCCKVYPSWPGGRLPLSYGLFKYLYRFYISVTFVLAKQEKKKKGNLSFSWIFELFSGCRENHRYQRGVASVYMNLPVYAYMCVSMLFTGNAIPFWLWWLCFHALILSGNDLITNIIY